MTRARPLRGKRQPLGDRVLPVLLAARELQNHRDRSIAEEFYADHRDELVERVLTATAKPRDTEWRLIETFEDDRETLERCRQRHLHAVERYGRVRARLGWTER